MRPTTTSAQNDGTQPQHRKAQFSQKETLSESERKLENAKPLTTDVKDDILYFKIPLQRETKTYEYANNFGSSTNDKEFVLSVSHNAFDNRNCHIAPRSTIYDGSNDNANTTLTKLKCIASDVTDLRKSIKIKNYRYKNNSLDKDNKNTNNNQCKEINTNYNLNLVVPKNLFVNNIETYDTELLSRPNVKVSLSETEPLLINIETTVTDLNSSICINKSSASLIFTKKDLSAHKSSRGINSSTSTSNGYRNYNSSHISNSTESNNHNYSSNFDYRQPIALTDANLVPDHWSFGSRRNYRIGNPLFSDTTDHRRSLQLNYATINNSDIKTYTTGRFISTAAETRKQHVHSWYAPVYSALQEELEQDLRGSSLIHNLAHTQKKCDKTLLDNDTSLEKSNLIETDTKSIVLSDRPIHRGKNFHLGKEEKNAKDKIQRAGINEKMEGPQVESVLGGPLPRRKRFQNFIKSLVSRQSSKENHLSTSVKTTSETPPLIPSSQYQVNHSPSDDYLLRRETFKFELSEKITAKSTISLNSVQQKLWNVVPLLRREGSCSSLLHEKSHSLVHYSGLRKCETVLALSLPSSGMEPIRPLNRLRISSPTINPTTCSRCSSLLSLSASSSRYSLNHANINSKIISVIPSGDYTLATNINTINDTVFGNHQLSRTRSTEIFLCKLCLSEVQRDASTTIGQCGCIFCTECIAVYIDFEITEGAYQISCPDAECPSQGIFTVAEISTLTSASSMKKYHRYRLNREIELDKTKTWCPRAGCETVCLVGTSSSSASSSSEKFVFFTQTLCAVQCPTCKEEFCSGCKKPWHPSITCEQNNCRLATESPDNDIGIPFDNDLIKCCPMCAVPIEKDEGCAQMMCKRCKHVFCWYCLASLDDDFLLRHYDKGPCKNKLGHSRASVVWHRAQVIGIFAGFGILLLVASPLLLLAAPCIICCKCRICNGTAKLDDPEADFDEAVALQR